LYSYVCVHVCVCVYVCKSIYICVSVRLRVAAIWTRLVRSRPVRGIRICACYGLDTQVIRRLIHGMIWRFVPVHAVKIRRRFGSKTTSFHVSVCFSIIFSLTVVSSIYILLVLFHMIIWYIIPVCLSISLHET